MIEQSQGTGQQNHQLWNWQGKKLNKPFILSQGSGQSSSSCLALHLLETEPKGVNRGQVKT